MGMIYLLLPLALIIAGVAVWAFVRSVRGGQFDDLETPAHRILHDETPPAPLAKRSKETLTRDS
jgi:cbb3-type cytochrome oxidase maturation protein